MPAFSFFFSDHFICSKSAPLHRWMDKVEVDTQEVRLKRWERKYRKRREIDQAKSAQRRREIVSRNNGERMMASSYSKGGGSGLTFCWRQSAGERVDKDAMRVLEEVRRNKSTEKYESTSGTRQEVAIYHFTQVTNVALLLSPVFVAMALLPKEATEFVFQGMSS